MNLAGRAVIALFLATGMLASCRSDQSTPTVSPADIMETAISTVSTAFAETQRAMPTVTATSMFFALPTVSFRTTTPSPVPTLRPSSTPLVFTDPSIPLSERIVYYYPVWSAETPIPEGTVSGLAPTYADQTYTSDTAADLRTALEIILHEDARRVWDSSNLEIVNVTFGNGHAELVIAGEYFAMGDAQPCIASIQILMTVFANPSVQTANVTLNGGPIGNRCFFGPPNQNDYLNDDLYTRAEIEKYMKENAYVSP